MAASAPSNVVRLEPAQLRLRDQFLGWQCRLRQLAVRQADGRPSRGMCPSVTAAGEDRPLGPIVVLINKLGPHSAVAEFRHMARRTQDPRLRREAAVAFLAASYYQRAAEFSDRMTALFGPGSQVAARLLRAGGCSLAFEQYGQSYSVPCAVRELEESDPARQATSWHNSLFNPNLPTEVCVLAFDPDWSRAEAEPPV